MTPVRRIELVHKVIMHKEHDPKSKAPHTLCQEHYLLAVNCKMVDRYFGLVKGNCTICK